jgi:4'-phosphopantetheinyl transferase EntD
MMASTAGSLESAVAALGIPGVMIGHRAISPGDEDALMPEEAAAFASSVIKVRRASGAARIAARALLAPLGHAGWVLPKTASGAPLWPAGVVGSLAHDADYAVAAVARTRDVTALGIDIEPAELLPPDVLELVVTPQERARLSDDPYGGRLLFLAKEAVYKAVHPLDRMFLDHHDVEVDLRGHKAHVRNGRVVDLRFGIATHLLCLAFVAAR